MERTELENASMKEIGKDNELGWNCELNWKKLMEETGKRIEWAIGKNLKNWKRFEKGTGKEFIKETEEETGKELWS